MRTNAANTFRGSGLTFEELIETVVERAVARQLESLRAVLSTLVARLPVRLLTVAEAARELGVHPETVRKKVRSGELAHRRVGRAVRIDIDASRPGSEVTGRANEP